MRAFQSPAPTRNTAFQLRDLTLPCVKEPKVLFYPLVEKARESCIRDFAGRTRKVPSGSPRKGAPFSAHPDAVAQRVAAAGYDVEVVAAAYLHDHIEDLPKLWNVKRIAQEFTSRTAELVNWVTEQDKSLPWDECKQEYARRLAHAPDEAVAISIADKTCNLYDAIAEMKQGFPVESFLKLGWRQNSARYHNLLQIFRLGNQKLFKDFEVALKEFDRLGSRMDSN